MELSVLENLCFMNHLSFEAARSDPTRPPEAFGVRAGSGPVDLRPEALPR